MTSGLSPGLPARRLAIPGVIHVQNLQLDAARGQLKSPAAAQGLENLLLLPLQLDSRLLLLLAAADIHLVVQRRFGRDGHETMVDKFRTMKVGGDGPKIRQATATDQRVTPWGRFLRRTSLDELPQFINVLQVNGWRGETETLEKMEKRVEYDLDYLTRWSLWFDLKIIRFTILGGMTGSGAY
jgi:putative colanic acid biosynthesis UDP-glucose lipid carrier transferase